jgi:hypothetical protein
VTTGISGDFATDAEVAAAVAAHVDDATDAHDATAISYAGSSGISATTVEAALDELDAEKQPLSSTLTTLASTTAAGLALMDDTSAAAQRSTMQAETRRTFNVVDYGAIGDGTTDDTAAIQSAVANAAAVDGIVVIPAGKVCKVVPILAAPTIVLQDNIEIHGPGTITVPNSAVAYHSIFGHPIGGSLTGFKMVGLKVNVNGTNNDFTSFTPTTARFVLYVTEGSDITVEGCTFSDINNVNTLLFDCIGSGATPTLTDVVVRGNRFLGIGGTQSHDHSTIYGLCRGLTVEGNTFEGASEGSAITAIETHASECVVVGNRVTNMRIGMAITGIAHHSDGITVTGNTIEGAASGILIATAYADGNTTTPAIRGLSISGNTIRCDIDRWSPTSLFSPAFGVGYISGGAPLAGVTITGNAIEATSRTSTDADLVTAATAGIILARSSDLSNYDTDYVIANNTIKGWVSAGVWLASPLKRATITGNVIVSCGGPQVISSYRCGVYVSGDVSDLVVSGNSIVDPDSVTEVGVQWLATTSTRCDVVDNHIALTSGTALAYGLYGAAQPRVRAVGVGTPEGVISALIGSTFVRSDGGIGATAYVKETGTGNTGWTPQGADRVLASAQFTPSGDVTYSTTSATAVVINASCSITFTVPASGTVRFLVNCFAQVSNVATANTMCIRDDSGLIAGTARRMLAVASLTRVTYLARVTGLTPGASLTWWPSFFSADGVNAAEVRAGDGTSNFGPILMEVEGR